MIIDFHTHLDEGLETQMKKSKVDRAILLMPMTRDIYTPNERVIYLTREEVLSGNESVITASNNSNKYIPFAWLNHKIPNVVEKLEDYVQRGFKGLKLHPILDHYNLLNPKIEPIIDTATHLRIPIMIHTGWGPNGSVKDVGELAEEYTDAKFIIAHMKEEWGVNRRLSHIKIASKHDNVWLECSYAEHPRRIAQAVEQLGSDRILFGSDFPFDGGIDWAMTKVTFAPITEEDKRKILGENALQLLNLESTF